MNLRWDPCVVQDAEGFSTFLSDYIDQPARKCLLIGGAGFDPRAALALAGLSRCKKCYIEAVFFREERLLDQPILRPKADTNQKEIEKLFPGATFPSIDIFDGTTAIGGRQAVEVIRGRDTDGITDIFVDISALSSDVFSSIISYFIHIHDSLRSGRPNVHLLVIEEPVCDQVIHGVPADSVSMLHGFKGEYSLDSLEDQALLWIPTLSIGNATSLGKIYQFIHRTETPIDVCPIIPFPGHDPRLPDRLIEEYREQLETWRVDHRNFLYAAESDPLDSYRAICALFSSRELLFKKLGGSQIVVSPLGNKMLSVGILLAAIEKKLPVVMVESVGYSEGVGPMPCSSHSLKHVWLCGEAYNGITEETS
jgi:hypothetical protein